MHHRLGPTRSPAAANVMSGNAAASPGAVILLPLAIMSGVLPAVDRWPLLVYFGLVPTALAYTLFYAGLKSVQASTAAVIALIEPLLASALGVLLFHEVLTPISFTGAAVLLVAAVLRAMRE